MPKIEGETWLKLVDQIVFSNAPCYKKEERKTTNFECLSCCLIYIAES